MTAHNSIADLTVFPAAESDAPATSLEALRSAFADAQRACLAEVKLRRFRIAGLQVEITFVGNVLAEQFTRSFKHLQVDGNAEEPALRIDLWDICATGTGEPHLSLEQAFPDAQPFADGELGSAEDGRYSMYRNSRGTTLLDARDGRAAGFVAAAGDLSPYEIGKPLQPLLFAWYSSKGLQPLHAACVARGNDGVLIGGAGGSGKSTTSLACITAGFQFLADDYVALPNAGGEHIAYSLYASLWLEETHSRRFSFLAEHHMQGPSEAHLKLPFALGDAYPAQMVNRCTVRAVLLPRITGGEESSLQRATPLEAITKMAPSSVLQLPFIDPAASLRHMAGLVRSVPAFWLNLGSRLEGIAPCVDEALRLAIGGGSQA